MLDFLENFNINENTLNELNKKDKIILLQLKDNEEEIKKIIVYLKEIGIKAIDELLLYKTDIFLSSLDNLFFTISKYDIKKFVEDINTDIFLIEDYLK